MNDGFFSLVVHDAAKTEDKTGFLMGFAAYAPHEMEIAVKKLANVLRTLFR